MWFLIGCDVEPEFAGRETVDRADLTFTGSAGFATWADANGPDLLLGGSAAEAGCEDTETCVGTRRVLVDADASGGAVADVGTCDYEDSPQPRWIADLTGEGEPEFASGQAGEHDGFVFNGGDCVLSPIAWLDVGAPLVALGSIGTESVVFAAPELGTGGLVFLLPGDRSGATIYGEGAASVSAATGDSGVGSAGLTADIDGDGLDDLVTAGSRIWVFTNAGGLERTTDAADAAGPGWVAEPGHALQASDIDGDGHLDVLAGDVAANAVVVLRGPLAGALSPWLTITGADGFGADVVNLGDVDGDSAPDLLVGAPEAGGGKGSAWLVLGPVASGTYTISSDDPELAGVEGAGGLGATVLAPGDGDGDGLAELVMAAPGAGAVYAFRGR